MISDLDQQVGRLLDALPANQETIIVFTSDQGLALGSHGLLGKQNCYEHSIRSPLILSGPGLPANERSPAIVTLHDLFPTLCELADIAIPDSVTGRSLVPLLHRKASGVHEFVTGMFTDTQRMICEDRWKLILYPQARREQLFDLQNDPDELHDLSGSPEHAAKLTRLKNTLNAWRRQHGDPLAAD
jgi:arylsulfatase A-like enzyme